MAKKLALLPCPFCGGKPKTSHSKTHNMHAIRCPHEGCLIIEVDEDTFEEAARRWNTRAPTLPSQDGGIRE